MIVRSEEESEMNFAYSTVGPTGTHFVTTGGQLQNVAKIQQNVANNGNTLQQVIYILRFWILFKGQWRKLIMTTSSIKTFRSNIYTKNLNNFKHC